MVFPARLPFEKWANIGLQLAITSTSVAWCLGDWLIYGENTYQDRYREAIAQTRLEYQTLRNYAWVSNRFPLSRRRDSLSFGHHAEVAALPAPEQDFWLRKSEELSWSRNRLRREVRSSLRERSAEEETDSGHPNCMFSLSVSGERLISSQAAADVLGISLEEWANDVLDKAAYDALHGTRTSMSSAM